MLMTRPFCTIVAGQNPASRWSRWEDVRSGREFSRMQKTKSQEHGNENEGIREERGAMRKNMTASDWGIRGI